MITLVCSQNYFLLFHLAIMGNLMQAVHKITMNYITNDLTLTAVMSCTTLLAIRK